MALALGVGLLFAEAVYSVLSRVGIVASVVEVDGVPLAAFVFAIAPWLFLQTALVALLARKIRP
jgi:hypothetical protein